MYINTQSTLSVWRWLTLQRLTLLHSTFHRHLQCAVDCSPPRPLKACSSAFVDNNGICRELTTTVMCVQHGFCLIEYLLVVSVHVNAGREGMAFVCLLPSPPPCTLGSRWGGVCMCVHKGGRRECPSKWLSSMGTSLAWLCDPSIWWIGAFFLSDMTPAECHWLSQNDGEGLSATPQSRDNFLKYVKLLNPQATALVSWISRKELLCLCEQPECVFVPGESWGGSGYSLPLSWSQKWTNLLSSSLRAAPVLTQGYYSDPSVILSHLQGNVPQDLQFTPWIVCFPVTSDNHPG